MKLNSIIFLIKFINYLLYNFSQTTIVKPSQNCPSISKAVRNSWTSCRVSSNAKYSVVMSTVWRITRISSTCNETRERFNLIQGPIKTWVMHCHHVTESDIRAPLPGNGLSLVLPLYWKHLHTTVCWANEYLFIS